MATKLLKSKALHYPHDSFTLLPFHYLLDNVEGFRPADDEGEKTGDDTHSEDEEEKSNDDTSAINQDDEEQPDDNNDANGKDCLFYFLRSSLQGNRDNLS